MYWATLLGIAVGLAMDAFAVSIVAGMTLQRVTRRHTFRLAFHFGLFQLMMPILGWSAGRELVTQIAAFDHWLVFGLLGFVGGKMLWDAREEHHPEREKDPTRGLTLVTLSVATSIDALAVGLSMAFLSVSIWIPSLVIGLVAAAMSVIGISFGSRIGPRFGRLAEAFGGVLLIGIGTKILIEHLTA